MPTLIQFSKGQTHVAIQYLIQTIAELAEIEQASYLIDRLSIVLAVMQKCHEAAPAIESISVEEFNKSVGSKYA